VLTAAAVATAGAMSRHRSVAQPSAPTAPSLDLLAPGTLHPAPHDPQPKPSLGTPEETVPVMYLRSASLRLGAEGPDVLAVQQRLDELGYAIANLDGRFGDETYHALVAFQKVNGLSRDGILGQQTLMALDRPVRLHPHSTAPGFHVEIELARQVLFLVHDGRVAEIYDTSTGSGLPYEVDGVTAIAHTPTGTFAIDRKIDGLRVSALGTLYRPAYFYGGYAIHGNPSVPAYPASHGCVRVTNQVMDRLFDRLAFGTPVLVY